ncbi:MAG TPA: response regulator [Pirellulales bacterium]|jgi:CheY-like chemotaxis protein|nr:response regulator [Pirellulales bacterium]
MTPTPIGVLHVEDDPIQQLLMSHQLAEMREYRFDVTVAVSEDEALALFPGGGFQLVILDYHLAQGDGVNCLRRIREIDRMVPIITVSGAATDEIAAVLISVGADDYLAKQILESKILRQSVRNVLTRAQAFRSRFAVLEK